MIAIETTSPGRMAQRRARLRRARRRFPRLGMSRTVTTGHAVAAVTDVTAEAALRGPLATLLAGQMVQDGEIIHFIIKPSRWFLVLSSLREIAAITIIVGSVYLFRWPLLISTTTCVQLLVFLIAARMMWAALQWMGRYYILTNLRVMRLSGVFEVGLQSCPLRKVKTVKLFRSIGERILGKGWLEVTADADCPLMYWQTLAKPDNIYEQVATAVQRAKQNGCAHE
jgi:hypothetical protein